jgi:integrase
MAMMSKRRGFRDGGIDARGENSWRLRYRVNGKRYAKAFHGTKTEAQKALRDLLHSGDTGTHVAPDKITIAQWVDQWIAAGAPGRSQKKAGRRTIERYEQLLRCHVAPALGDRPLQQLQATEIDRLYVSLAATLNPRTARARGVRRLPRNGGPKGIASNQPNGEGRDSPLPWRGRSWRGA